MYLIRKNFNIAQNDLIEQYHFSKTDLGTMGFWFAITYGVGKTVVGYFGDGKNTKNVVAILLILASLTMVGTGLGAGSLRLMTVCYAMNGFFQSGGGPASYATINRWVPRAYRGTALGCWNISHNLGGSLAATVAILLFHSHACISCRPVRPRRLGPERPRRLSCDADRAGHRWAQRQFERPSHSVAAAGGRPDAGFRREPLGRRCHRWESHSPAQHR